MHSIHVCVQCCVQVHGLRISALCSEHVCWTLRGHSVSRVFVITAFVPHSPTILGRERSSPPQITSTLRIITTHSLWFLRREAQAPLLFIFSIQYAYVPVFRGAVEGLCQISLSIYDGLQCMVDYSLGTLLI